MTTAIPEASKVQYEFLGRSGMKVSNVSLGCMTFGENSWGFPGQLNEDASHQILNRYAEWGGNFLDTADVYGEGQSEIIVGKWLERQTRDKYVIATKCRGDMGQKNNVNNIGLSRRHITASVDGSLKRLHTNFIDLYQTHMWDDATPIEETLRTLNDLVRIGKIRYIGLSNVTGWQISKIVEINKHLGLNQIVSLQQQYNLVTRESEYEPFQVCKAEGLGVLPWSPLKAGVLTGKFTRGVAPKEGRAAFFAANMPEMTNLGDKTFDTIDVCEDIAKKRGRSIPQVAIRWLLQKDVVPSVIIGARTIKQLDDNMAVNGWCLTKEEMKRLDDVSAPFPIYPYGFLGQHNQDRKNPQNIDTYVRSTAS